MQKFKCMGLEKKYKYTQNLLKKMFLNYVNSQIAKIDIKQQRQIDSKDRLIAKVEIQQRQLDSKGR